jgi:hypothetical protein
VLEVVRVVEQPTSEVLALVVAVLEALLVLPIQVVAVEQEQLADILVAQA